MLLTGFTDVSGKAASMEEMFGLVGEVKAMPGRREELLTYLLEGAADMPGNLAYVVAEDLADPDAIWITEIWRTRTDHANSLKLPAVRQAIEKARPIIAGFGARAETRPIGWGR